MSKEIPIDWINRAKAPRSLDTIFAHKAINLASELSGTDKRVAAAVIDSFNRTTGQCDPSLGRIARLLGISRRTVIRSVQRLERSRFIRKFRHGGKSHRNSYEPNWPRFRELETHWNVRFRAKRGHSATENVSPLECQSSHVAGVEASTQTFLTNPSEETSTSQLISKPGAKEHSRKESDHIHRKDNDPTVSGGTSMRFIEAARASAERRRSIALHDRYAATPIIYGDIIEAIDPAMQAAATEAEMRQPGTGLTHILNQLQARNAQTLVSADGKANSNGPQGTRDLAGNK